LFFPSFNEHQNDWCNFQHATQEHRFALTTPTTPIQLNTLSGNLEVQAVINKTSELDLSSRVSLDGQATLELRYL
jgi:hypothetical protein